MLAIGGETDVHNRSELYWSSAVSLFNRAASKNGGVRLRDAECVTGVYHMRVVYRPSCYLFNFELAFILGTVMPRGRFNGRRLAD